MKSFLTCLLVTTLCAALPGCGDDTGGSGGGGSDDDTSGAGDTTATSTSGAGANPATCAEVCDQTPVATAEQGDCVAVQLTTKGYDVAGTDSCSAVVDVAGCNRCYTDLGQPTDAECVAAYDACF